MTKHYKSDQQLKQKLIDYKFIFTSNEFNKLKTLGYYHVFNSIVPYKVRNNGKIKKLDITLSIYELDSILKTFIFPLIIGLENFFKQKFNDTIFDILSDIPSINPYHNTFMRHCVSLKNIHDTKKLLNQSSFIKNPIVNHYFNKYSELPMWSYLEVMTLGAFNILIEKTNDNFKKSLSEKLNLVAPTGNHYSYDPKYILITNLIKPLNDLRNNIAHNQPIYDVRFKKKYINIKNFVSDSMTYFKNEFNITQTTFNIDFGNITDYILLIVILYKYLNIETIHVTMLSNFLDDYILKNRKNIHAKTLLRIFGADYSFKINYIKSLV